MKLRNDLNDLSDESRDVYKYIENLVDSDSGIFIDRNGSSVFILTRVDRDITITVEDINLAFSHKYSIYEMLLDDWPISLANRDMLAGPYLICMEEIQKLYELSVSRYIDNYFA